MSETEEIPDNYFTNMDFIWHVSPTKDSAIPAGFGGNIWPGMPDLEG